MVPASLPSERVALCAVLDPVSQGAATVTTGWVAMKDFHTLLAVLAIGAMTASSTVDAKLQQATDGAGAGAKDVTGSAITQLTQAGGDANKQVEIQCRTEDLDVKNGFTHVRLSVTVAAAASLIAAQVWGFDARFGPAADNDAASVKEIKTV